MMIGRWPQGGMRLLPLFPLTWLLLVGCPGELEESGLAPVPKASSTKAPTGNPNEVGGSVGGSNASPTPTPSGATPSPTPTVSPSPVVTASPAVAIRGLAITPATAVLVPPATDPALSLGLQSEVQFTAYAQRADEAQGGVVWSDGSGGQLLVSGTGKVSARTTTTPGTYTVRVRSIDDPNVYQDVTVQVLSTGELEAIIQ